MLFWPHPSRWLPNLSKICPQEQRLEPKSAGKSGMPNQMCNDTTNSLCGMARPVLGLGIAGSHAPACCADVMLSQARSRKLVLSLGLSTLATGSRSNCNAVHTCNSIAIGSRSVRSTSRGGFDRDQLNPIRNSGRYLHVRYACSRNI